MNLASLLDGHPADAPALMSRGDITTYGQLREQAGSLRGGLAGLGLVKGDRVGIICANNWYFVVSYLACIGSGIVAVPLNPMSPGPELERELGLVGARAVIVGPAAAASFGSIDPARLPSVEFVIDCAGRAESQRSVALDDLLASDATPMADIAADDLAVLMFTSGTAGEPKAAMLTHAALIMGLRSIAAAPGGGAQSGDVVFAPLPLFHIYGLQITLSATFAAGAMAVVVERFDPASAVDTIRDRGVTIVCGPPALWSALASLPGVEPSTFDSVRVALTGAAPLSPQIADSVERYLGVSLIHGYGLTESSSTATSTHGVDAPIESIGRPLPGVAIRLVDPQGEDVLIGDEGEVLVKSGALFSGYWEDPAATAAALDEDGWLHTGDIGVVDDNGVLFLVDRVKDLVIVSGFNVFPAEVENAIRDHPAVAEAAVIGVPHPHSGEAVQAFVVIAPGQVVEEDAIIEFCGGRLARYKCPNKVVFVDEIPTGVNGKILRRTLRPGA